MPREIHIRKDGDRIWYRCWSTIVDAYITEETDNPDALCAVLLEDALKRAEEEFMSYWPRRIEAALKDGTSGLGTRETDQWDLSMEERVAAGEFDDELERYYDPELDARCVCDRCGASGPRAWDRHSGRYLCRSCNARPNNRLFGFYVGDDPGQRSGDEW